MHSRITYPMLLLALSASSAATTSAGVPAPVKHPPRSDTVQVSTGVRLHYVEQGDPSGETIILLHGYSDSWFSFSQALPLMSQRYHIYALDLRGQGSSDTPAGGYGMVDQAADVIAFMDARSIRRATVVGHSTGSFVARQVAHLAPDRIVRLVLVASSTTIFPHLVELRKAVMALTDPVSPQFVEEFQRSTVHHPVSEEFMRQAIAESMRLPVHVWHGIMEGMATMPAGKALGVTTAPTLIMAGARDVVFPGEVEPLRAQFPHASVIVYEDTGHAVHWERPEWFVRDLEAFLTRPAGSK